MGTKDSTTTTTIPKPERQERDALDAFDSFGGTELKRPPAIALRRQGAYVIGLYQGHRKVDVADEETGEVESRDVVDLLYMAHGGPETDPILGPSFEIKGDDVGPNKPCSVWGTAVIMSKLLAAGPATKGMEVAIRREGFLPKKGKRQAVDYTVKVRRA